MKEKVFFMVKWIIGIIAVILFAIFVLVSSFIDWIIQWIRSEKIDEESMSDNLHPFVHYNEYNL